MKKEKIYMERDLEEVERESKKDNYSDSTVRNRDR